MKIGTADATALYLGTTSIDKAYLGTTVVWETSASPNWSMIGDISSFASRAASLTNIVQGGEVSNFTNFPTNPIRTNSANTYIEFIFLVQGWSTGNDFVASTTARSYTFEINSLAVPHTSVTESTSGNNNLVRIRFNDTSAIVSAFWNANIGTGNPVAFSVTYS